MADEQPIFVKSARISAHLYFATEVAKRISLTSKNARAITVRAGMQAAGFTAITDFIEELSKATIASSERINQIAVNISRIATDKVRAEIAQRDFNRVRERGVTAPHLSSIADAIDTTDKTIRDFNQQFTALLEQLTSELVESKRQIRASAIIVSTSKIEASQSGDFQRSLEVIAEDLEQASTEIKNQIFKAEKILDEAKA
ncbi:MAG: hypothetical protein K6L80_08700 [Agarilytica sp.]